MSEDKPRFKIDFTDSGSTVFPFGLFYFRGPFGWRKRTYWKEINRFEKIDEARKYYEIIKNLPEYLP